MSLVCQDGAAVALSTCPGPLPDAGRLEAAGAACAVTVPTAGMTAAGTAATPITTRRVSRCALIASPLEQCSAPHVHLKCGLVNPVSHPPGPVLSVHLLSVRWQR